MPSSKSYNRILDEHLHILVAQGNHEAFLRLRKRYQKHARGLVSVTVKQYETSGVCYGELLAVCENRFLFIVSKYEPQLSSFYTFWKEVNEQAMMDYLLSNSYLCDAKTFRGFINLDEEFCERRIVDDQLREFDDDYFTYKLKKEIKRLLSHHKHEFKRQELAIIHLVLEGYSIKELEHAGILKRSTLYLTFNNACKKIENIVQESRQK